MTSSHITKQTANHLLQDYRVYGNRHVKHYRVYGEPNKYSQKYERDPYSQIQNFLYKRAIIGLNVYTQKEIQEMHWQKRKRVKKVHKRAQRVLNTWKQEITINITNLLFSSVFPKTSITKTLLEESEVDCDFKNTLGFKELGITKDMVIEKFVDEGILPSDFYNL